MLAGLLRQRPNYLSTSDETQNKINVHDNIIFLVYQKCSLMRCQQNIQYYTLFNLCGTEPNSWGLRSHVPYCVYVNTIGDPNNILYMSNEISFMIGIHKV